MQTRVMKQHPWNTDGADGGLNMHHMNPDS